jgi:hypothetical protein
MGPASFIEHDGEHEHMKQQDQAHAHGPVDVSSAGKRPGLECEWPLHAPATITVEKVAEKPGARQPRFGRLRWREGWDSRRIRDNSPTCQTGTKSMDRIRIEQHSGLGVVWIAGWLFTIGYLKLAFWQGALALLIWPYDLGAALKLVQH